MPEMEGDRGWVSAGIGGKGKGVRRCVSVLGLEVKGLGWVSISFGARGEGYHGVDIYEY